MWRRRRSAIATVVLLEVAAVGACGGTRIEERARSEDAGADTRWQGKPVDLDTDDSGVDPDPPPTPPPVPCQPTNLVGVASQEFAQISGNPPVPSGGVPLVGSYRVVRIVAYGVPSGAASLDAPDASTVQKGHFGLLEISAGEMYFYWSYPGFSESGGPLPQEWGDTLAKYVVDGTSIRVTVLCQHRTTSKVGEIWTNSFSAGATSFERQEEPTKGVTYVTTYERR